MTRCQAVTKKGVQCKNGAQCKHSARVTIPNVLGGGPKDSYTAEPWIYGRPVHVCLKHSEISQQLIEGGFLQHYNMYKYGSVVLDRLVTFDNNNNIIGAFSCPKFWQKDE